MHNIEEIVSLVKNNLDIFPYLEEVNENINLIMHLYHNKIDITKHLSENLKKNKTVIDLSINLNPLNILSFDSNYLSTNQIFNAIKDNNKLIQFLTLTDFKKNKIKKSIESLDEFDYSTIKNDIFFINDQIFMENALNKSPFNIIYFKNALNREEYAQLFLKMIRKNHEVFKILNIELFEDEDYLIKILKINPETYTLFPNHKKNLKKIRDYILKDGLKDIFKYLTYSEKTEEVIYNYLNVADFIEKNTVFADKDIHSSLFKNKEILLKLILNNCVAVENIDSLEWANEKELLNILRNNGNFFVKLSEKQKEMFTLIKAATLESNICCTEFFHSFNDYPEIIKVIIEKNIDNYERIDNKYKKNINWILKYLDRNPIERFHKIPNVILHDIENLFVLASTYPELLEIMDEKFRNNKNNILRLINENPKIFKFMDYSVKSDIEIADYAISKDLNNISNIGINLYDEGLIINNFFRKIINGEKYCEDKALFIFFFKDVLDPTLFIKALEAQGSLYEGLSTQFDEKEYLIAALKGGFTGYLNPIMELDSDLLYILLKYHPEPINILNTDFFLKEEDMIIKVLGENSSLFEKPFFHEYKISLSFAEKLININPENIIYIMDIYFLNGGIKDMSLIDKVIIENPENFNLIEKLLEQIEGIYLLNKDTILKILDHYISKRVNKKSLTFLYKIPEILRNNSILKKKYDQIFGEKRNFINELLFKMNLIKNANIYPFAIERLESIIIEDREKEEEAKKLEDLFHLRNFIDKTFLVDLLKNSKVNRQISQKYYKNTKALLDTIYYLKSKNSINNNADFISNYKILEYVEVAEIDKEDFIEYIGILYLNYFQFKEKDIVRLYGYKNKKEKEVFIQEKILKNKELSENISELNNFIISSIFIGNNHTLLSNYFDDDFKFLIVNKKAHDIRNWRIYKTEKDDTTLPLRKIISSLFDKSRLDYIDIDSFYKSDKTRSEKSKNDLIYTHKKKIENQISPSLEAMIGWKITILSENNRSRKFSLILEK